MKNKIQDIAKIQTGIYSKTLNHGDVYYIQARDFDKNRELFSNLKPGLLSEDKFEKHYLKQGDVLIAAKGYDNFAALFKDDKLAVASSIFIIVRINNKKILSPEFLTWYINHPKTQKTIQGFSKGSALPSISKSVIGELEIPVLPIDKQKLIIKIDQLNTKEKEIKDKIAYLQNSIIQQKLLNALK